MFEQKPWGTLRAMRSALVIRGHRFDGRRRLIVCAVASFLMSAACTETTEPSSGASQASSASDTTTEQSGQTACAERFERRDAGSGLAWRLAGDLPVTAPVVAGSTVLFGANGALAGDGCVGAIAVDTGDVRWTADDAIDPYTLPVSLGDVTVAAVDNGRFTGYETASGRVMWATDSAGAPGATPGVDDGLVFVESGSVVRALDPADGKEKWSFTVEGQLTAGAMDHDLVVVSAVTDGPVETYGLDRVTGVQRFRTDVGSTSSTIWAMTASSVVVMNAPNTLYGLDRAGNQQWELNVPGDQNGEPVVDGDEIYFTANDYGLYAVNARTGEVDWVDKLSSFTGGASLLADGLVITFAGFFDPATVPAVVGVDARTGEERWRVPLSGSPHSVDAGTEPLEVNGTLYVGFGTIDGRGGVIAIDPRKGELSGAQPLAHKIQRTLASDGSRLFVRAGDTSIGAITLPLAAPTQQPP